MNKKYLFLFVLLALLSSCGDSKYGFQDFSNSDSYKSEFDFQKDHNLCQSEKDKHSHKIEGRKFGFKGADTGFLGCMKLKDWSLVGS